MAYDAFLSYSHAADGRFAPALQDALKALAKPWYRRRALSVFRDQTDLSASADLTAAIRHALANSSFFVYLASPAAAQSRWVGAEIEAWRLRQRPRQLLIALTDGDIAWSEAAGDFDWERSTAVHPALKGMFPSEPLWVDLRWAHDASSLSPRDPRFQKGTAMLAAPIHGCTPDELIGEDVRQHRRTRSVVAGTIAVLAVLVVLFVGATTIATRSAQALQTKLTLIELSLPLFHVGPVEARLERGHAPSAAWQRLVDLVRAGLQASEGAETWVGFGPTRLVTREDCRAARERGHAERFECPAAETAYDRDGLRTDIPGLAAMGEALTSAVRNGRLQQLLETSRLADDSVAEGALSNMTLDDEEQETVAQWRVLLPELAWQALPADKRGEAADRYVATRGLGLWRRSLAAGGRDAELVFLRVVDSGYCGSMGCSFPTLGFLRLGAAYALVFAQTVWGDIAVYDAGAQRMPQIFVVGSTQSGATMQYRQLGRLIFSAHCQCYEAYLIGAVLSLDREVDQTIPQRIAAAPPAQPASAAAEGRRASNGNDARAGAPARQGRPVRVEEIVGRYELVASERAEADDSSRYAKARLEIRALDDGRVLLLMGCSFAQSPGWGCWGWWLLEYRNGWLYGGRGTESLLRSLAVDPQAGTLTLESGDSPGQQIDTFGRSSTAAVGDAVLDRRLRVAELSWAGRLRAAGTVSRPFDVAVTLTRTRPEPP